MKTNGGKETWLILLFKRCIPQDFPGDPVVMTSPSNAGGKDLISGQGAKISLASWPKCQNIKQMHSCNKFNKDFKDDPHTHAHISYKKCSLLKDGNRH